MTPSRIAAVVVVILAVAVGAYFFWPSPPPPPPPAPPRVEAPPAAPPAPQGPQNPVPAPSEAPPLPGLKDSDPALRDALSALIGSSALRLYLVPEEIVRHIVATIDNLPRKSYAARLNPVKGPGGLLATTGQGDSLAIAPANAERYAPYVRVFTAVDTGKLVAAYVHLYPLFQQAYEDLGYPNGYFNDRLVEVIDHLLATPDVKGPIRLVVPHVLYEYADPDLQSRSAGQKLLIRMGSENAAKVKAKLREIRDRVAKARP